MSQETRKAYKEQARSVNSAQAWAMRTALTEFCNAFNNRGETTSIKEWNDRMKVAYDAAVLALGGYSEPKPQSSDKNDSLLAFLEQAGAGCISGQVIDWPQLKPACKWAAEQIRAMRSANRQPTDAPKQIIDPPGAAVEMFRRRHGRLPNRVGDQLPLTDRLELAAQACHAAHLLSCEATCREALQALSADSSEGRTA